MPLVLVEHQDGHPDELSLQALALARGLAGRAASKRCWSARAQATPRRSSARTA